MITRVCSSVFTRRNVMTSYAVLIMMNGLKVMLMSGMVAMLGNVSVKIITF